MEDKKKMHIRVRYLICLLFVLYFVLYIFGKKQLCVELVLVVECALATLIIELIRKYFRKNTGEWEINCIFYRSCSKNDRS